MIHGPFLTNMLAKALGLRKYLPEAPCCHGHHGLKYVDDGCVQCKKEKQEIWIQENRERKRERDRLYYAANPDKFRQRDIKKRLEHQDRLRELRAARKAKNPNREKELYAANRDARLATAKAWRARNHEMYAAQIENRRSRKLNAEGTFSADDVERIRELQGDRCAYCRCFLRGKGTVDHIVALSKGGSNWPRNLQLVCGSCNSSKHNKDPIDFSRHIGLLI